MGVNAGLLVYFNIYYVCDIVPLCSVVLYELCLS